MLLQPRFSSSAHTVSVVLVYSQLWAGGARMALTLNLRPEPLQGRSRFSGLQRFWNRGGSAGVSGGRAGPWGAGPTATTSAGLLQEETGRLSRRRSWTRKPTGGRGRDSGGHSKAGKRGGGRTLQENMLEGPGGHTGRLGPRPRALYTHTHARARTDRKSVV